jgi:hypothetical protein
MCQDAKDIAWHAGGAERIQELHCLHLEAVVAVYHKENDVRDLSHIYHGSKGVRGTFEEGQTAAFGCNNSEGACW